MPNDACLNSPDDAIIFFDNTSSLYSASVQWSWDFDDPLSGTLNTSSSHSPTHTFFGGVGTYDVILTLTDGGCTSTETYVVNIYENPDVSILILKLVDRFFLINQATHPFFYTP